MKRIIMNYKSLAIATLATMALTSCLKDKGFENGEYGLSGFSGKEFVSIGLAANATNALALESKNAVQDVNLFAVTYDNVDAAPSDIKVTVAKNDAAVTAVDPSLVLLPASVVSIPSLDLTIAKGKRVSAELPIKLNTGTLDPTKKYGIAFTLSAISKSGVAIPANLKTVVFAISLKNKYDGIYTLKSRMDIASDRSVDWLRTPFTYPYEIKLVTTGPNSVAWVNTAYSGDLGYHPLMTPAASGFGATQVAHEFDVTTNALTRTYNAFPNPANGRAFINNSAVANSRYDAATKTVYAAFVMTQPGFQNMPIYDTLVYLRAR